MDLVSTQKSQSLQSVSCRGTVVAGNSLIAIETRFCNCNLYF